jgi:hypothetical protein
LSCIQCQIRDVCTIYQAVNEARAISKGLATIEVPSCKIKPNAVTTQPMQAAQQQVIQQPEQNMMPLIKRNFREESVKAQADILEREKELMPKVKVTEDGSEKVIKIYPNCPSCGGRTTDDDIDACTNGCGKIVCSNCSTEIADTKERLCKECYDKR